MCWNDIIIWGCGHTTRHLLPCPQPHPGCHHEIARGGVQVNQICARCLGHVNGGGGVGVGVGAGNGHPGWNPQLNNVINVIINTLPHWRSVYEEAYSYRRGIILEGGFWDPFIFGSLGGFGGFLDAGWGGSIMPIGLGGFRRRRLWSGM